MRVGARAAAAAALAMALVGGGAMALWPDGGKREAAAGDRPELALLSSLPLLFGERFGLEAAPAPAIRQLERRYRLVPIAVADASSLRGKSMLLMAHARAQPAEALVDLDRWVRRGGRLVLLADPRLDFDSSRGFGDPLRPAPSFADTGLLAHWGLTLAEVEGSSWGMLSSAGAACVVTTDARVARCRLGAGRATVLADADLVVDGRDEALRPLLEELAGLE